MEFLVARFDFTGARIGFQTETAENILEIAKPDEEYDDFGDKKIGFRKTYIPITECVFVEAYEWFSEGSIPYRTVVTPIIS